MNNNDKKIGTLISSTVKSTQSAADTVVDIGKKLSNMLKRHISKSIVIPADGCGEIVNIAKINIYLLSIAKSPKEISIVKTGWGRNHNYTLYLTREIPNKDTTFICKDGYTICRLTYTPVIPNMYGEQFRAAADSIVFRLSSNVLTIEFIGRYRYKYYGDIINMINKSLKEFNIDMRIQRRQYCTTFGNKGERFESWIPLRSFDSIVCSENDNIKKTIHRFYDQIDLYKDYHIVYKTGILLYGAQGCGKSSIIKAIINELVSVMHCFVTLYFVNMGMHTPELEQAMNIIYRDISEGDYRDREHGRRYAVIVLEEIDSLCDKNIKDSQNKTNLMLQYLDGPYSHDGTIFIATTNKYEKLDARLIRDSRFDCKVEVQQFQTMEDVKKLCDIFGVDIESIGDISLPVAPCTIQGMIFENYKNQ